MAWTVVSESVSEQCEGPGSRDASALGPRVEIENESPAAGRTSNSSDETVNISTSSARKKRAKRLKPYVRYAAPTRYRAYALYGSIL